MGNNPSKVFPPIIYEFETLLPNKVVEVPSPGTTKPKPENLGGPKTFGKVLIRRMETLSKNRVPPKRGGLPKEHLTGKSLKAKFGLFHSVISEVSS